MADPTRRGDIFVKLPNLSGAQQLMGCDIEPKQVFAQRVPQWSLAEATRAGVEEHHHIASKAATMACAFVATLSGVSPGL